MQFYLLARCEGFDRGFKGRTAWFRKNRFNYIQWEDHPYWTKIIAQRDIESLSDQIEKWPDWMTRIRPLPVAAKAKLTKSSMPPEVNAAMKEHVDFYLDLPGWKTDWSRRKWLIAQVIKKYRHAMATGEFCLECKIRPRYDNDKCRPCAGLSLWTWKGADGPDPFEG